MHAEQAGGAQPKRSGDREDHLAFHFNADRAVAQEPVEEGGLGAVRQWPVLS